jgi:hypothetical protein
MSRLLHITLALLLAGPAMALDFDRDIRPILSDKCFHCHGPDPKTREAKLRLDTLEGATAKHGDGAAIVPGKPDQSMAMHRVLTDDPDDQMPPPDSNRVITPEEIAKLRQWIKEGAPWSEHWAYVPPKNRLPRDQKQNPIDYFVERKLKEEGLPIGPPADRQTLLRRVTLDLTGLAPTLDEQNRFLADSSDDAYARLVDRLLKSPQYGERMAWPWLDLARYADSNGYQHDADRKMYPWRDWVVKAFNENMPFDQFTIWQLAGDLLPDSTFEQRMATAFLRNSMINAEGGRIPEENRVEYIFDHLETVGTAWLGLTFNCARCHDHKYDELSQKDYYRFFAFFNQTPVDGEHEFSNKEVEPPLLKIPEEEAREKQLEAEWKQLKESYEKDKADVDLKAKYDAARKALNQFRRKQVVMMVMEDGHPRKTFTLVKGGYQSHDEEVTAGVPHFLDQLPENVPADRLALARWLVSGDNPLTARVVMNRLWAQFFGIGLVKTTENFGVQGERPVNHDLLDWLAVEFVRSGWDVQHMVRMIVSSDAYRRSSDVRPDMLEKDPANRFLARGARYRMPSWMIRDQALAVSGLLVPTMGGPGVNTYQPPGVWEEMSFGKIQYKQGTGDDLYRRSLYLFWRRIVGPTMFFDSADRQVCEVKDKLTNTPLHALSVLNDPAYVEAGRALAVTLMENHPTEQERIEALYKRILCRAPKPEEVAIMSRALQRFKKQYAADAELAQAYLHVGEYRIPDSLDPVEAAAYANACLMALNLDETLTRE